MAIPAPASRPPTDAALSRRSLLLGGTGLALGATALAACTTSSDPSVPEATGAGGALLAAFPQGAPHVPVGVPTRLPYLITDDEGVPLDVIDGAVPFEVSRNGEVVATYEVEPRSEGIPRGYLPLINTFDDEGVYDITATYDGATMTSQLQVFPQSEVVSPVVGQQLPSAPTPTTEKSFDVDPICTLVPQCPFHTVNLEDALGGDKPIVLLVATPAYCQTAFCGPTLGNLVDLAEGRDDLTVIHAEVYQRPAEAGGDLANAPLA
ncbi:MAG: hypothetical protein KDB31_08730, partial [Microthrixaceae bacterium]|nr:hypothetical protein [Microthrixaceae bacterium]